MTTLEEQTKQALSQYLICNREEDGEWYSFDFSQWFEEMMDEHLPLMLQFLKESSDVPLFSMDDSGVFITFDDEKIHLPLLDDPIMLSFADNVSFRAMILQCLLIHCNSVWTEQMVDYNGVNTLLYIKQWNQPSIMSFIMTHYHATEQIPTLSSFLDYKDRELSNEISLMV